MTDRDLPSTRFAAGCQTILVVDDVSTALEVTRRWLTEAGYRVFEAACAAGALEVLATARPPVDLLITDVVMPEVSGVELVQRVKKRWPRTHVLFMSGYEPEVLVREGLGASKAIFLAKPFDRDELLEKVTATLRHGPKVDELESAVDWPFPARRVQEATLTHARRLRLLREISNGADNVRGLSQSAARAKLAEWAELEGLRDIRVRVIWDSTPDREHLFAAFAVLTQSGNKLLDAQALAPKLPFEHVEGPEELG